MKIWVVGTPGSGKSSFAGEICFSNNFMHIELDGLVWGSGWRRRSPDEILHLYNILTSKNENWVCDGNYYELEESLINDSDLLIWIKTPLYKTFYRVLFRSLMRIVKKKSLWNGNVESFRTLFKYNGMLWYTLFGHRSMVKQIERIYQTFPKTKFVIKGIYPMDFKLHRDGKGANPWEHR
ncbi:MULTISPECIES: P-loop NTPase family protein [Photorhabdus]|uniref:Adenylate kinase n=2 Tax=Photorhabdus asymbiotica TaxID=291112 RepID=C7BLN2_PHOAA|nr:hypothetical protein [Photorhabdus asymbiotica]RKS57165.1 hypothetical protein BDD30_3806 [Photorhabdus asymbiotica]CAQ84479.1 conserved hypothetical protein [Photorhabdus asymbiotica]